MVADAIGDETNTSADQKALEPEPANQRFAHLVHSCFGSRETTPGTRRSVSDQLACGTGVADSGFVNDLHRSRVSDVIAVLCVRLEL
jgi:hypothetical protein